ILNVYITKYDGGGQFWPLAHNTIIFSLLVAQVIALGVFGQKRSTIASGFTIPLLIGTVLFNEYCRQRFLPVFKNDATQVLIDMDTRDKNCGRLEEIYDQLHSAYCQFKNSSTLAERFSYPDKERIQRLQSSENLETGKNNIQQAISWSHR
ncbi:ERD (early-responsive to dehydration stress) family protein, partial [Trifolium pratense]